MAQNALNDIHKQQIIAGTKGRIKAHKFEQLLSDQINNLSNYTYENLPNVHNFLGNPAKLLLNYLIEHEGIKSYEKIKSYWLGGLATNNSGDILLDGNNRPITKCKSDIVINIIANNKNHYYGVSVKSCNKKTPTNDQMYFTTARAFCELLRNNNINVSANAEIALKMFCGDIGYRPIDDPNIDISKRLSDIDRWFWEELPQNAIEEWEKIFMQYQYSISMLLFQKAYKDDPFPPTYLIHQKVKYEDINKCPVAIFTMDEICKLSLNYSKFNTTPYKVNKGRYKNDPYIHYAPKFGFIQMQRGGQKQHPTQLQFNLKSGYFNYC